MKMGRGALVKIKLDMIDSPTIIIYFRKFMVHLFFEHLHEH